MKYRFEQGVATAQVLKTKHLRLREHDLTAQYGFENSAAACRPSEGYEDIQSETNDVDFTDKSFYNYCTSSRDSVDESLDCDETQRSKDCLAKEALRLNDTNMSSSMNEEETMSDGSPALSMSSDIQNLTVKDVFHQKPPAYLTWKNMLVKGRIC